MPGKSRAQWEDAGYTFADLGICRSCGAPIHWVITPIGKRMPMAEVDGGYVSHFSNCPNAAWHRKPKEPR